MARGDGTVWYRKDTGSWWIRYSARGKRPAEGGFKSKTEARNALDDRRLDLRGGTYIEPQQRRSTVDDLIEELLLHLETKGAKALASFRSHAKPVKEALGLMRAVNLTTKRIQTFQRAQEAAGRKPATVNRQVGVLRAAFRLAQERDLLTRVPKFPMLDESGNVRLRFLEPEETKALLAEMPGVYAEILRFVSLTGWRISEVLGLRWQWIDRSAREVRLPTSKNGKSRVLNLGDGEVWRLLEQRWKAREYQSRSGSALSAHVFHQRGGRPVSYAAYRKTFNAAKERVGLADVITHDFRRTVSRNLRRKGISETVSMTVTGHKTASTYRRYSIVDGRDQREALRALEEEQPSGAPRATVAHLRRDS